VVAPLPDFPVAVRFGKHAEGLIRVKLGGCQSVDLVLARLSLQYQALYRKKWLSWLMISRITRFTIGASTRETLCAFKIALALNMTGYPSCHELGSDFTLVLAELESKTRSTITPDTIEPFIWIELGPDDDRLWKLAGYVCIYNHLCAALMFYTHRHGYLNGLRVVSDVVSDITFTGCSLPFIREAPYSHFIRSQRSNLMTTAAAFQVIATAVELYLMGWHNMSTTVYTVMLLVLTLRNDGNSSSGKSPKRPRITRDFDIASWI
jgi:hypothetical protein